MKKIFALLLCVMLSCACLFGCDNVGKKVVLKPQSDFAGKTLYEYMLSEKENGRIDFSIEKGMIDSVNGIKNTTNTYWMLYTDDKENSNATWGSIEHEGKTYASASLGAESLVIAKDCAYIWVFTKF